MQRAFYRSILILKYACHISFDCVFSTKKHSGVYNSVIILCTFVFISVYSPSSLCSRFYIVNEIHESLAAPRNGYFFALQIVVLYLCVAPLLHTNFFSMNIFSRFVCDSSCATQFFPTTSPSKIPLSFFATIVKLERLTKFSKC